MHTSYDHDTAERSGHPLDRIGKYEWCWYGATQISENDLLQELYECFQWFDQ